MMPFKVWISMAGCLCFVFGVGSQPSDEECILYVGGERHEVISSSPRLVFATDARAPPWKEV